MLCKFKGAEWHDIVINKIIIMKDITHFRIHCNERFMLIYVIWQKSNREDEWLRLVLMIGLNSQICSCPLQARMILSFRGFIWCNALKMYLDDTNSDSSLLHSDSSLISKFRVYVRIATEQKSTPPYSFQCISFFFPHFFTCFLVGWMRFDIIISIVLSLIVINIHGLGMPLCHPLSLAF